MRRPRHAARPLLIAPAALLGGLLLAACSAPDPAPTGDDPASTAEGAPLTLAGPERTCAVAETGSDLVLLQRVSATADVELTGATFVPEGDLVPGDAYVVPEATAPVLVASGGVAAVPIPAGEVPDGELLAGTPLGEGDQLTIGLVLTETDIGNQAVEGRMSVSYEVDGEPGTAEAEGLLVVAAACGADDATP